MKSFQLERRWLWAALPLVLALVFYAIGKDLPANLAIRSRGTMYPKLNDPTILLLNFGALSLLLGLLWSAPRIFARIDDLFQRRIRWAILAGFLLWIAQINWPPNFFTVNGRIHWVESLGESLKHSFYLGYPFYYRAISDFPFLATVLHVALNFFLMDRLGRLIFPKQPQWARPFPFLLFFFGPNWIFPSLAEDVHLTFTVLLINLILLAAGHKRAFAFSFFLIYLVRPTLLPLAVAAGLWDLWEIIRSPSSARLRKFLKICGDWMFLMVPLCLVHGVQYAMGVSPIFSDLPEGKSLFSIYRRATVLPTDGFSISAFSGTYLLHFLWAFPLLYSIGFCVQVRWERIKKDRLGFYVTSATIIALLFNEANPLLYYNFRYLSYLFPFLVVALWRFMEFRKVGLPAASLRGFLLVSALLAYSDDFGSGYYKILRQKRHWKIASLYFERAGFRNFPGSVCLVRDSSRMNIRAIEFFTRGQPVYLANDVQCNSAKYFLQEKSAPPPTSAQLVHSFENGMGLYLNLNQGH